MPKVSIIIPVYKAEQYIDRCVRALFGQNLRDLEYIFVDDCSPDRSIDVMEQVLREYPDRQQQVKIIRHQRNMGVGQSRQDGIDEATGEYIIHCDPDDWVEPEMYYLMYDAACRTNADIVVCDYFENTSDSEKNVCHGQEDNSLSIFNEIVHHKLHTSLWNKLVRRDYAIRYRIPAGVNLWEDMSVITPLLLTAKKIHWLHRPLYHYRIDNSQSILHKSTTTNVKSQIKAVQSIVSFLSANTSLSIDNRDVIYLKWSAKRNLLSDITPEKLMLWNDTFPEIHSKLGDIQLSFKFRIISYLAIHKQFRIIKILNRINNILN